MANIPGLLAKLLYLSGLRGSDGLYEHWGLARVYGEEPVQRALAEVHRHIFLKVLRMPLRELLQDAMHSTAAQEIELDEFLRDLEQRKQDLLPPQVGGGSQRHFNSVVEALLWLEQNRSLATH